MNLFGAAMNTIGKHTGTLRSPDLERKVAREQVHAKQREQEKFWRLHEVESITGLKKSTIYRMISEGLFPSAIRISARCVAWNSSSINAWLQERIASASTPAQPSLLPGADKAQPGAAS
jgi:prophage regulatory protein